MKRGKVFLFSMAFVFLTFLVSFGSAVTTLSNCGTLSANTAYNLSGNLTATVNTTCITAATNATLDCAGFAILGNLTSTQTNIFGVTQSGTVTNFTLSNCIFDNWTGSSRYAAFISGKNSNFYNITLGVNSSYFRLYQANGSVLNNLTLQGSTYLSTLGDIFNLTFSNIHGRIDMATNTGSNISVRNWDSTGSSINTLYGANISLDNLSLTTASLTVNGNSLILNNSNFTNYPGTIIINGNNSQLLNTNLINSAGRISYSINSYNSLINNLTVINNTGSIYSVGFDDPKNVVLANSYFNNYTKFYMYHSSGDGISYGLNFTNNTFIGQTFSDRFTIGIASYSNYNTTFNSNKFYKMDMNGYSYNSSYINNLFDNSTLTLRTANNTNFSGNYFNNSNFLSGYLIQTYNLKFNNNTGGYTVPSASSIVWNLYNTTNFEVYNNTCFGAEKCINTQRASNGLIYNNYFNDTINAFASHAIMVAFNSYNLTVFNNTLDQFTYGLLFEYGAYNNTFYNNTQNGGIFYSLHNTHDNVAYNNYINGDMILHNNVTNEYFHDNIVTGNLFFRWDTDIGIGLGAYNNTIANTHFPGNLNVSQNSLDNNLENVTITGTRTVDSVNISSYTQKWYLSIFSNLENVTINIKNSTGQVIYSNVTDSNFSIPKQTLAEFKNLGGVIGNYSNYTISANKTGYDFQSMVVRLSNNSAVNFTMVETDTTAPTLNFSLVSVSRNSILFNISLNDSTTGINSSCTTNRAGAIVTGNSTSQNISEDGLTCATTYSYLVNCSDVRGNVNSSNVSYTTSDCEVSPTTTSGGSYSVPVSTTSLQSGATQSLYYGMKLIVPYKTENHTISLNKINRTNSEVSIDIYSEKQTISLKLNESKEVDLNKDSVADVKVTLLKVYDNLVKVDLKIELLNNAVKEENKTSVGETIKNVVTEVKEKSSSLWITLIIILVLIVAVFVLWKKKFSHDYRFRLLVNKIKYSSKH